MSPVKTRLLVPSCLCVFLIASRCTKEFSLKVCEPHCQILFPIYKEAGLGSQKQTSKSEDRHAKEKIPLIGIQPANVKVESGSSPEIQTACKLFRVWNTCINVTQCVSLALNSFLLVNRKISWGTWSRWES